MQLVVGGSPGTVLVDPGKALRACCSLTPLSPIIIFRRRRRRSDTCCSHNVESSQKKNHHDTAVVLYTDTIICCAVIIKGRNSIAHAHINGRAVRPQNVITVRYVSHKITGGGGRLINWGERGVRGDVQKRYALDSGDQIPVSVKFAILSLSPSPGTFSCFCGNRKCSHII